jgi:POT family proton-dependent oligopeptide transporter
MNESAAVSARLPGAIPYIVGNEGCERFSFYGMRNILTSFLIGSLLLDMPESMRAGAAKDVFHTFVIGVYFFPLLGGYVADRFFGKYGTVFWLSLVYCAGHACLALFEGNRTGFYAGLFLIAFGSGGIKPLISSFVGDQFDVTNKHLAKMVFDAFYWIINFGSFFASLLMPLLLKHYGASVAFGVPGVLMFLATIVFWLGRHKYVRVPPAPAHPHSFGRVLRTALMAPGGSRVGQGIALAGVLGALGAFALIPSLGFVVTFCIALVVLLIGVGGGAWLRLDRALPAHPEADVTGAKNVLRVLVIFGLTTPFFSLFDQKASTWVVQGGDMLKPTWFLPSQMQALNPLLVMLLIPFNNFVLYPALRRRGIQLSALRRMTYGIAFSGLAWIAVGTLQLVMDAGHPLMITWQMLPYVLLTFGEVLVSATGLEFAYSQAPPQMKGVVMSFWNLTTTVGNLWVLLANAAVRNARVTESIAHTGLGVIAFQMFCFAAFALVAAVAFGAYARGYREADHYRGA